MHNLIAHALVKNEKGEILIIRRTMVKRGKKNFQGGKWDIPGGTVESLELPSVAAKREVKEEVDIDVEIEKVIYEESNLDAEKQAVFTTLIYSCKTVGSLNIVLDFEEHDEYKWVTKEEILNADDSEFVTYMKKLMKL